MSGTTRVFISDGPRLLTAREKKALMDGGWERQMECGCVCVGDHPDPNCTCQGTGEIWARDNKDERPRCPQCASSSHRGLRMREDGYLYLCECQPCAIIANIGQDVGLCDALILFIEQIRRQEKGQKNGQR